MAKKVSIRRPQLRITSKGVHITKPSARVGGAVGVNVSAKGASASVRTKRGTLGTKRGCGIRLFPVLILFTLAGAGVVAGGIALLRAVANL